MRALKNADGKLLDEVGPGYPAEMEGWRELPPAGELVLEVETEKKAKEVVQFREDIIEKKRLEEEAKIINEKRSVEHKAYREQLEFKRKLGRYKLKPTGPRKPELVEGNTFINFI